MSRKLDLLNASECDKMRAAPKLANVSPCKMEKGLCGARSLVCETKRALARTPSDMQVGRAMCC